MIQTSQNDLGFSLYTMLFICYIATTSEVEKSIRGVSADSGVLLEL